MTDYKLLLLISLASLFIAEWSGVVQYLKYLIYLATGRDFNKRLKPFDCGMCLTFWNTLAIFVYLHYEWYSLLYAFANAGVSVLICKVYNRLDIK